MCTAGLAAEVTRLFQSRAGDLHPHHSHKHRARRSSSSGGKHVTPGTGTPTAGQLSPTATDGKLLAAGAQLQLGPGYGGGPSLYASQQVPPSSTFVDSPSPNGSPSGGGGGALSVSVGSSMTTSQLLQQQRQARADAGGPEPEEVAAVEEAHRQRTYLAGEQHTSTMA